jgi:hypothetical protein
VKGLWEREHDPHSLHTLELEGSRPPVALHYRMDAKALASKVNQGAFALLISHVTRFLFFLTCFLSQLVDGVILEVPLHNGSFAEFVLKETTTLTMMPGIWRSSCAQTFKTKLTTLRSAQLWLQSFLTFGHSMENVFKVR